MVYVTSVGIGLQKLFNLFIDNLHDSEIQNRQCKAVQQLEISTSLTPS